MSEVKIKTVLGTDIFVNGEGKFFANIKGRTHISTTLSTIEKKIRGPKRAVKALFLQRWARFEMSVVFLAGIVRNALSTTNGRKFDRFDKVVLYDPDLYRELMGLKKEYDLLCKRWDKALRGRVLIGKENWDELIMDGSIKDEK